MRLPCSISFLTFKNRANIVLTSLWLPFGLILLTVDVNELKEKTMLWLPCGKVLLTIIKGGT